MEQDIMSTVDIVHIRGAYPHFLCEESFTAEYNPRGFLSQRHTAGREGATCKKCIEVLDREANNEEQSTISN